MKTIKRDRLGYLFILPFFIILVTFIIYPIIYSIYISFTEWQGALTPPKWIGLDNYIRVFKEKYFIQSIGNTWILWLGCIIPQMIFGLGLAAMLTDSNIKGKAFFRWAYFVPNLITMASIAALFVYLLDWKTGALNEFLISIGVIEKHINWLQNVAATRIAISFILFWMWFGYTMIIFMAGIKAIPSELYEAARVDGANKWQSFRFITLPSLKPIMAYQVVTSVIGGLTMFDIPFILTGRKGSPNFKALTMVNRFYNVTFSSNPQYGFGAAMSVLLFIMVMIFSLIAYRFVLRDLKDK
ncbi:MAG: carbohydrate ABC transporter permease [Eubacteriales bacterium]